MRLIKILFFLITINLLCVSANALTLKLNTGVAKVEHLEEHSVLTTKNISFEEYLLSTQLSLRQTIISRLLNISADVEYLYPKLSPTSTQDITFLNYNARITFIIPSRPFTVAVAAEYYSDTPTPSHSTFGYAPATGIKYSAIANLFIPKYALNINLFYPFTTGVEGYQQSKASITYYFGMSGEGKKGSSLLKQGTSFQIDYEYKKIHENAVADPIDVRVRALTASLGFIW